MLYHVSEKKTCPKFPGIPNIQQFFGLPRRAVMPAFGRQQSSVSELGHLAAQFVSYFIQRLATAFGAMSCMVWHCCSFIVI